MAGLTAPRESIAERATRKALAAASSFLTWWWSELVALVPGKLRRSQLILSVEQDGLALGSQRALRYEALVTGGSAADRSARIDAFLAAEADRFRVAQVVLRVSQDHVLSRIIHVPSAGQRDAQRLAMLDLERTTPLDCASLLTVAAPLPATDAGDKVRVRQLIIRRAALAEAEALLAKYGMSPGRIECMDAAGVVQPFDFLAAVPGGMASPAWQRRGIIFAATGALATAAFLTVSFRCASLEAELEAEIGAERRKLAAAGAGQTEARNAVARASALEEWLAAQPSRALLLENLSRLLPSSDFLTSLQIEGREITLSGVSASAADLVPLFERSGLVEGAALTGQTVADAKTGKERFSLRARAINVNGIVAERAGR